MREGGKEGGRVERKERERGGGREGRREGGEGRTGGGGVVVSDEAVHGASGVLEEANGRVLLEGGREGGKEGESNESREREFEKRYMHRKHLTLLSLPPSLPSSLSPLPSTPPS